MQDLSIITAVSRVENLDIIKSNIEKELIPYFNVTWYCIYDIGKNNSIYHREDWIKSEIGGIPNDCGGGSQRNIAMNLIKSGWIYCLDDDNLMYKDFGKIMNDRITQNPNIKAFIFNQDCCSHRPNLLARPENVKVAYIDMAQILFHSDIINGNQFLENNYGADGYFIEKMYNTYKDKILLLDEYLCYYNALKPKTNNN